MRPDPRPPEHDDSGRIIYLGDVRRRRGMRRRAPDRTYLGILTAVAVLGWLIWLGVVLTIGPVRLLTYLAFFLPLAIAIAATATLALYTADWHRGVLPDIGRSTRRGLLIAAGIVLNLAALPGHHWNVLVGAGSVALAVGVDVALAHRLRRR